MKKKIVIISLGTVYLLVITSLIVFIFSIMPKLTFGAVQVEPAILKNSGAYTIDVNTTTPVAIFQTAIDYNRMTATLFTNNIGYDIAIGTFAAVNYSRSTGNNFIIPNTLPYYSFNDILYRHIQQFWAILDPLAGEGNKQIKILEGRK